MKKKSKNEASIFKMKNKNDLLVTNKYLFCQAIRSTKLMIGIFRSIYIMLSIYITFISFWIFLFIKLTWKIQFFFLFIYSFYAFECLHSSMNWGASILDPWEDNFSTVMDILALTFDNRFRPYVCSDEMKTVSFDELYFSIIFVDKYPTIRMSPCRIAWRKQHRNKKWYILTDLNDFALSHRI